MTKKIIVIEGYLASGKSTFAVQLSKTINVPYLIKDTFKTALCNSISIKDRTESSCFSAVTFDAMMYVTERLMETGYPIIVEGNFVPAGIKKTDESSMIKTLIDRYGYTSLTFKFVGDTHVLHQRFIERENTLERGQANKMGFIPSYHEFDQWCHNLDMFDIGGKILQVDTTDFNTVDFTGYFDLANQFIKEKRGNDKSKTHR